MNTCMHNAPLLYYRIYRLKLKHHLLDLLLNFTSQNSGIIAKRFDKHAIVFISGWYKTEGEGKRCFVPATDEDNAWLSKCLAIIPEFWLVKFGYRSSMSIPSHKGFFSYEAPSVVMC